MSRSSKDTSPQAADSDKFNSAKVSSAVRRGGYAARCDVTGRGRFPRTTGREGRKLALALKRRPGFKSAFLKFNSKFNIQRSTLIQRLVRLAPRPPLASPDDGRG